MVTTKLFSVVTTSSLLAFSCLTSVSAQVTPDGTTSTTVDVNGNDFTINQGDRAGGNLFHSFGEFSVPTDGSAFFDNALDIINIFSRVTGGNISNIDGLLRANGAANLFLINPAGIIFGEGARLDIGGSFYGSTADSVIFSDGEFSALDTDNPPLLTINAPLGLGIRDNPADIVNSSFVTNDAGDFVGLEVRSGNSLNLVGGNIDFEAGEATASGGRIELGGLSAEGTVTINGDGTLSFPEDVPKADVTLSNAADLDVRGTDGGSIAINARDLTLEGGDFGGSEIRAGILDNSGFDGAQAGDININATGAVNLSEASSIENEVNSGATGNSGDILINAGSFSLTDEASSISSTTFGQGNAGNVNLQVQGEVNLVGGDIFSQVGGTGTGDSGSIAVNATNISLLDGSEITTSTFGQGNAGAVNITATDTVTFDGEDSESFNSGAFSTVGSNAVGDAGGIEITTVNLTLTNGGVVNASTFGQGNAGTVNITATDTVTFDGEDSEGDSSGAFSNVNSDAVGDAGGVTISTGSLAVTNGGQISASTFGQGNAGAVNITATDTITFDGEDSESFNSGAFSTVGSNAVGDAGGIEISTANLTLTNGGTVSASTFGQGNAGIVNINASDTILVDGEDPSDDTTGGGIFSNVSSGAVGNAGGVEITTVNLTLTNAGIVTASTFGRGNAGTVKINASGTISADGQDLEGFNSGIFSDVNSNGVGNAGGVEITTTNLTLTNGGIVSARTNGQGDAGTVAINASGTISVNGEDSAGFNSVIRSNVSSNAIGNAGGITINTGSLALTNGGTVSASTFGQGNAGTVNLTATDTVTFDGEDSEGGNSGAFSTVGSNATGNAGGVTINTGSLSLTNGGIINAGTFGQGNAGGVNITATDTITFDGEDSESFNSGAFSNVETDAVGDAGGIEITTANLTLTNGGTVGASTFGQGNAGTVKINASDTILVDGEDPSDDTTGGGIFSNVSSGGVGNAGGVEITTANLTLTNGGVVNASTFGQGNGGTLTINASGTISADGQDLEGFNSGIFSDVNSNGVGNAGGVEITTANLTLTNGGIVSARTNGQGDAGTVAINALDTISVDGEDSDGSNSVIRSNVSSNATGDAGGVNITTGSLALTNGGTVSASTFGQGNAGTVNITATDTVTFDREDSDGFNSGAFSTVGSDAVGDAGGVNITTGSLALTNGGQISASTFGQGNAGAVNITATDTVTFDGENSDGFNSGAFSTVGSDAVGDAGGVTISTGSLSLTNEGQISASTFGQGDAGTVTINASESVLLDDGDIFSQVNSDAVGNAGGVNITTGSLVLTNGGQITTDTSAQGNGGGVRINASESVLLDDGDIFSEVNSDAVGNAGTLEINTVELSLINNSIIGTRVFGEGDGGIAQITTDVLNINSGARIDSSTSGNGNAGSVIINNTDLITLDGENSSIRSRVNSGAEGDAGGVTISTGSLAVTNGGQISASTRGQGNAGSVNITATDTVTFDGEDSEGFPSGALSTVGSNAVGNAGGVNITTGSLVLTNGGQISASTFGQGDAGTVSITASDTVTFDGEDSEGDNSGALSTVGSNAVGDAGGVTISTSSLFLTNGALINASTFGQGNAGGVNITATGTVSFNGEDSEGFNSGAFSNVSSNAVGDAGGIEITTANLTLTNGGTVSASTFAQGNAGTVRINASDTIFVDGEDPSDDTTGGGIFSNVSSGAVGNAGGVEITTANLTLTNGGVVNASTFGQGNAGTLTINASGTISADGQDLEGFNSGIYSDVNSNAVGNAGGVEITTGNLSLTNGGIVSARTNGQGDAGTVAINASGMISVDGEDSQGVNSIIRSNVNTDVVGNAGGVTITTGSLSLTNGGTVSASTFGQGNAGSVNITATDTITIDGEDSEGFVSGATSQVNPGAVGNAGGVTITTGNLTLTNGGQVAASTFAQGDAGTVTINASENIFVDGEDPSDDTTGGGIFSTVGNQGVGNAGGVEITTANLTLTNGGTVSASTFGQGNAGTVTINASGTISADGQDLEGFPSGIFSQVNSDALGNAGGVEITTANLTLTNGGTVSASTFGQGNAGAVNITATDTVTFDGENSQGFSSGAFSNVNSDAVGNAGGVTISTGSLFLTNGGQISASTFGEGDAGTVNITATDTVTFDGEDSDGDNSGAFSTVGSDAVGDAGGVTITTGSLSLTNGAIVSADTFGQGNAGNITINANSISLENQGRIESDILGEGSGGNIILNVSDDLNLDNGQISATNQPPQPLDNPEDRIGGNIQLQVGNNLILRNNSTISAEATNNANGGNVNIGAGFIVGFPSEGTGSDIRANAGEGRGGNITINTQGVLGFEVSQGTVNLENDTNDIDASSQTTGLGGIIIINAPDVNPLQGVNRLPTNPVSADTIATDACSSTEGKTNLSIQGKGGIPPQAKEPLSADSLVPDGQPITVDEEADLNSSYNIPADIKPVKTDNGDIYPARGVIVKEDGTVILTAYPTDNKHNRVPQTAANCNS